MRLRIILIYIYGILTGRYRQVSVADNSTASHSQLAIKLGMILICTLNLILIRMCQRWTDLRGVSPMVYLRTTPCSAAGRFGPLNGFMKNEKGYFGFKLKPQCFSGDSTKCIKSKLFCKLFALTLVYSIWSMYLESLTSVTS